MASLLQEKSSIQGGFIMPPDIIMTALEAFAMKLWLLAVKLSPVAKRSAVLSLEKMILLTTAPVTVCRLGLLAKGLHYELPVNSAAISRGPST